MAIPLKFTPYSAAEGSLDRRRLIDLALSGAPRSARSSLLIAPAGYGKTTLLAQLTDVLRQQGSAIAWLNCTREDQEPDTFLDNLGTALQAAGLFHRPPDFAISEIVDALERRNGGVALAIDEYENASSEGTDNLLETLIRSLPANARLLIASREIPKLSLSKLLVENQARLVDAPALQFSDEEARALIAGLADSGILKALIEQSEGWPVMLQLARLDLLNRRRTQAPMADSGEQRARVFDYLAEQVIAALKEEEREFLIALSILPEIDLAAALAITKRGDAYNLMRGLLRINPVITLIKDEPLAIRLHPLFRVFLQERLERKSSPPRAVLHRRAAIHFAARQQYASAVEHAVNAGDIDLGAQILEDAGGPLLNISEGLGRVRTFMSLLPQDVINRRPRLRLMRIVQQGMEGISAEWIYDLERLKQLQRTEAAHGRPVDENLQLETDLAESVLNVSESRYTNSALPLKRMEELRRRCQALFFEDARYLGFVSLVELMTIYEYGTLEFVDRRLEELRKLYESANFAPNLSWVTFHAGVAAVLKGDLKSAEDHIKIVLNRMADAGEMRNITLRQESNSYLGLIYYEQNNLELAAAHFSAIPRFPPVPLLDTLAYGFGTHALADFYLGQENKAIADIDEAYQYAVDENMPHFPTIAAAIAARLRLLGGDMDGCRDIIRRAKLEEAMTQARQWFVRPWEEVQELVLTLSAYWRKTGRREEALQLAADFARITTQCGRLIAATRGEILAAEAHLAGGDPGVARPAIARALGLSLGTAAVCPFLEASDDVLSLVRDEAQYEESPRREWARAIIDAWAAAYAPPGDVEGILTPRERDVLLELSKNQPTKIVARTLNLSPETVRHHLKNIYIKLKAHTRDEAVMEARRQRLIP